MKKYFGRREFLTQFIRQRKQRYKAKASKQVKYGNPGVFYVFRKIKKESRRRPLSFTTSKILVKNYLEEWRKMDQKDKEKIVAEWKTDVNRRKQLINKNNLATPAYSKFV